MRNYTLQYTINPLKIHQPIRRTTIVQAINMQCALADFIKQHGAPNLRVETIMDSGETL